MQIKSSSDLSLQKIRADASLALRQKRIENLRELVGQYMETAADISSIMFAYEELPAGPLGDQLVRQARGLMTIQFRIELILDVNASHRQLFNLMREMYSLARSTTDSQGVLEFDAKKETLISQFRAVIDEEVRFIRVAE